MRNPPDLTILEEGLVAGMRADGELDEKHVRTARATLGERLLHSAAGLLVGRERELDWLVAQLSPEGTVVSFVHGMGGIGKTALLAAAKPRLTAAGARVLVLDGRTVEPTPRGFLHALGRLLELDEASTPSAVAVELERCPSTSVLMIDEFDHLRLLDDWFLRSLLPALPERTRWIVAGRLAPGSSWLTAPGWGDAAGSLRLDPLDEVAAQTLLERRGVQRQDMPRLVALARGLPLALTLVTARTGLGASLPVANESAVLDAVARHCVDELEPSLRAAVEAGSVVRRITHDMLEAMLGGYDARLTRELAALSFVEHTEEGLRLHESVRHALAARLRALEPARHRRLRRAAWHALETLLAEAPPTGPHAWRLTADMLFLIEHPEVREAFFPSAELEHSVGGACAEDEGALAAIVRRHEPPEWLGVFEAWWSHARSAFRVVRDAKGGVLGFTLVSPAHALPEALIRADPLLQAWQDDVRAGPGRDRGALFMRRALSERAGEEFDAVRSVIWRDVKRLYVEHPGQWALYVGTRRGEALLNLVARFGFARTPLSHAGEHTVRLEFGATGLWSWLCRLAEMTDLGAGDGGPVENAAPGFRLDEAARALLVGGAPKPLSALEYGVLKYLLSSGGRVVTRDELLDAVWQQRHSGSNVVDAVIRLLRKKLGPHARALETVRGHGYRLTERVGP